jgi:hypothetical protein
VRQGFIINQRKEKKLPEPKARTEKNDAVIYEVPQGFAPARGEEQMPPAIHNDKTPALDDGHVIKTDKKTKQVIKTFTSQDGSTISIVQDKGQIEIRLKGNH